jgi:acyl carrier protein
VAVADGRPHLGRIAPLEPGPDPGGAGGEQTPSLDRAVMTDDDAVFREICRILERSTPNGVQLTPTTELTADLNIDSVAAMDLIMQIEDKFGIDIPINLVADLRSLQDLVDVVQQQIRGR